MTSENVTAAHVMIYATRNRPSSTGPHCRSRSPQTDRSHAGPAARTPCDETNDNAGLRLRDPKRALAAAADASLFDGCGARYRRARGSSPRQHQIDVAAV